MSIPPVNIKQAVELTISAIKAGVTVLCHGSPGIGKSQGWAKKTAEKLNAELFVFIPSHHDPIAINGLPAPNVEEGTTNVYMTKFFSDVFRAATENKNKDFIIFLDEIGQASSAHQAPLMELIHEKKIAGKRLPNNCHIIAATNKITDGAMVQRMATPLRNRFVHFELVPDRTSWIEWMINSESLKKVPVRFKTVVQGFLEFKPDSFYTFDPKRNDMFAFATPRSWEAFMNMASVHVGDSINYPDDKVINDIHTVALASIGEPVASDFAAFMSVYAKLPSMRDIEEGRNPTLDTSDPAVLYALTAAIVERLNSYFRDRSDDEEIIKAVENLHKYAVNNLHKDLQVWLVKSLYGDVELQKMRTPSYKHWQGAYVDRFIEENIEILA